MAIDAYTKLLLHMNGVNGSSVFSDSSLTPHTMTPHGNAVISTAQSKFGGASLLTTLASDYLTTPGTIDFQFGTADFTVDFWINYTSGTGVIWQVGNDLNNRLYMQIFGGKLRLAWFVAGVATTNDSATTVTTGVWHHIALVRYAGTFYVYLDGVLQFSVASYTMPVYSSNLCIGSDTEYGGGSSPFNGYIDEFRVSKGIARWTAAFTPPMAAYDDATAAIAAVTSCLDTTAGAIVTSALRKIGAYSPGDQISPESMSDGIRSLNVMIKAWQAQNLIIPYSSTVSFSATGNKGTYTIGLSGADITTSRPLVVNKAWFRYVGGAVDYDLDVRGARDYDNIAMKSLANIPSILFYNPTVGKGTINIYPIPGTDCTVFMDCILPLDICCAQNTVLSLTDEFVEAVEYNLACRLSPEYSSQPVNPDIKEIAILSLRAAKQYSASVKNNLMTQDAGLHPRRGGSPYSIIGMKNFMR